MVANAKISRDCGATKPQMVLDILCVGAQRNRLGGLSYDILVLAVEERYEGALGVQAKRDKLCEGGKSRLGAGGEGIGRDRGVRVVEDSIRDEEGVVSASSARQSGTMAGREVLFGRT